MSSNNRYATLDSSPLKALSQLGSLTAIGDKDVLIGRLMSQDLETPPQRPANDAGAKSAVHVSDGPGAEPGWEIVGTTKKKDAHGVSSTDTSLPQSNETHQTKIANVAAETAAEPNVAPNESTPTIDSNSPISHSD